MIRRCALFLALSLLPFNVSQAQAPRPTTPLYSVPLIQRHLATSSFPNVRTVCPSGCDFATISAALAYVATQTRSLARQWTVLVFGGVLSASPTPNMNYSEVSLSVPTYTTLRGFPGAAPNGQAINITPNPTIELTASTGTQVLLSSGSGLSGLNFYTSATLTGNTVMVRTTGSEVNALDNVQLWGNALASGFTFEILSTESLSTTGINLFTVRGQNGSSSTVKNVVARAATQLQLGRHQPGQGTGQIRTIEVAGGTLRLSATRIISGSTTDLVVVSGSATLNGAILTSFTGAVTGDTLFSANGTAAPSTCSPGQIFVNTTASAEKLCACNSSGAWRCASLN